MKRSNNQGFTLIEIAIVLTIVGLIIGGIWLAAATVLNNYKMQALNKDVIQIMQNTKAFFAGQGASAVSTGFTFQNAVAAGIYPADMISSASKAGAPVIVTPFSTDATLIGASCAGNATDRTQVSCQFGTGAAPGTTAQGLPSSACTQLLTTLGSLNNIQKYGISYLSGTAQVDLTTGGTVAVTPSAAAAACFPGNVNIVQVGFSVF